MVLAVAFDADDTLWHNETQFRLTQARFEALLSDDVDIADLKSRLLDAERRNLGRYGFGVKGFTLSMIETAIEVTQGRVSGAVIAEILACGRGMLDAPVEMLPHVRSVVETLSKSHLVMVITKGDLLDQERKVAQSGLGELFAGVEIVSNKDEKAYRSIFAKYGIPADRAVMVGNSMKSDILPALAVGAYGVFVPYGLSWALEHADPPANHARYFAIDSLAELPDLVAQLA